MVKQKFDPGALVFGKVKGYPPWPARVTALSSKDRCGENDFGTFERKRNFVVGIGLKTLFLSFLNNLIKMTTIDHHYCLAGTRFTSTELTKQEP